MNPACSRLPILRPSETPLGSIPIHISSCISSSGRKKCGLPDLCNLPSFIDITCFSWMNTLILKTLEDSGESHFNNPLGQERMALPPSLTHVLMLCMGGRVESSSAMAVILDKHWICVSIVRCHCLSRRAVFPVGNRHSAEGKLGWGKASRGRRQNARWQAQGNEFGKTVPDQALFGLKSCSLLCGLEKKHFKRWGVGSPVFAVAICGLLKH